MAGEAVNLRDDPQVASTVDDLIHELRPLGRPSPVAVPTPPAGVPRTRPRLRGIPPPKRAVVVRACVSLNVLLGVALTQWPYDHHCGWGLSFYLFAVSVLVVAGVWGLLMTWTSRLPISHTIALGTLLWGLTLSAQVALPRVGYAKMPATWTCPVP